MSHQYERYKNFPLWDALKKALNELKENQDIKITTKEEYVIGYLCKSILDNDLLQKTIDIPHLPDEPQQANSMKGTVTP